LRLQHKTVRAVTEGIEGLRFNTGLARLMELVNALTPLEQRPRSVVHDLVLLLAPYAPHLCEELWRVLGHGESLAYAPWPTYDEALLVEKTVELPVQVNGKVRAKVTVAADADEATVLATAKADPKVAELLAVKTIVMEKYVPGRLISFAVKD
jgi:leucyl-tRNA synthetase